MLHVLSTCMQFPMHGGNGMISETDEMPYSPNTRVIPGKIACGLCVVTMPGEQETTGPDAVQ